MKRLLVVALVLTLGLSVAGLAAGKVAVVLDVGGRGDLAFNDMGFKGTDQAAKDFNLQMVEVQCATGADYLPNMRNLARTGEYDLIICVGFLLGDALAAAATEFPNQKFAIIDVDYITGPNIMNFVFRENEMSALVGALAACPRRSTATRRLALFSESRSRCCGTSRPDSASAWIGASRPTPRMRARCPR